MAHTLGRSLIFAGGGLIALGLILLLAGKIPYLGHLPGDIQIRRGNFSFFFPLTSSLIISVALSLLFSFFKRR
jgi:hypothetical protein